MVLTIEFDDKNLDKISQLKQFLELVKITLCHSNNRLKIKT